VGSLCFPGRVGTLKGEVRRTKDREFWRDNGIFGAASLIAGLFNYLYHVVLAHVLGPRHYGDLTTFLNVTAFLVLPAPVVTLVYTRMGKKLRQGRRQAWYLWGGGIAIWLALAATSPFLGRLFHVSPFLLVVFTLEVVPSFALAANVGILQRVRWYVWAGLLTVLNTGFRVIAAGIAVVFHHYPLFWVGLLEGVAAWVTWGVSRRPTERAPAAGDPSRVEVISGTAVVGVINVLFSIIDGLLAKHSLGAIQAGRYNGLATIGHTIQFISGSFGTVMLTSILADPDRKWRFLGISGLVYLGIALVAEGVFLFYGRWVVTVILGRHFLPIVGFLPQFGWGMMALGLLNILMLFSVAENRWAVIGTTGLGLVWWIGRLLYSHSVAAFVAGTTGTMLWVLGVTVGLLAWLEWGGRLSWRRKLRS